MGGTAAFKIVHFLLHPGFDQVAEVLLQDRAVPRSRIQNAFRGSPSSSFGFIFWGTPF